MKPAVGTASSGAPTVKGLCFEAEQLLMNKGVTNMGGWKLENIGGVRVVRYVAPNRYGSRGPISKLCYKVNIPRAGAYNVFLYGRRDTRGRKPIKCNHSDKEGSLRSCSSKNNGKLLSH